MPLTSTSPDAVRLRLDLAYDGTDFAGWAPQPALRTVGGDLSAALTTLLRQPDPVRVTVAGRTDAGVHASGQVAHIDAPVAALAALPGRSSRTPEAALVTRLSGILSRDIVVRAVTRAPAGFDARFSALERRYRYRLADPEAARDPLRRRDTVWWRRPLDVDAMNRSSRALEGLGDFAAFCRRREGATTIRTLIEFSWCRLPDGVLEATVRADAFCHSMVRSLVGAVVRVGEGQRGPDWPAVLQRGGVRGGAGGELRGGGALVVPALGLSLEEVVYPSDRELAMRSQETRARRHVSQLGRPADPGAADPGAADPGAADPGAAGAGVGAGVSARSVGGASSPL